MPPASNPPDTPSPAKKRKTELTPVKHGIDFFFKKQGQNKRNTTRSNGDEPPLFEDSDDQDDFELNRRKQEEEDERLAKELQSLEGQQEVDDEEFARRLAKDYEVADAGDGVKQEDSTQVADDTYGGPPSKPLPTSIKTEDTPAYTTSSKLIPQTKLALNESNPTTSLEEIYAIPLDKDPLQFNPATDARCASTWALQNTPYAFLTHAFILINSTRSRLKIVNYLVNALRVVTHHDPTSLLPLVWLTTNAIAPPFEGVELNLGGSVISKALISASGLTSASLKSLYDKHGDVGDVAFEAKMAVRTLIAPAPLTVKGVYTTLRNIARAKGTGSAETKRRLVERLLVSAKGEEVRYIGRTLVQHLRIGAVKTTMLICLSRAFSLTAPPGATWSVDDTIPTLTKDARTVVFKRAEEIVKQAFARQPSYDDLVPALLKLGVEKLATECTMRVGVPIKPMLGNITKDLNDMAKILEGRAFTCEFKYDGQRAQIHLSSSGKVSIFSRHLELMTEKYPDLVALIPQIRAEGTESFIMEGEVVAVDDQGSVKTFQTLAGRGKKNVGLSEVKVQVCLYAFDLMYLNGESLLDKSLRKRRDLLRSRFVEVPHRFTWVKSLDASSKDQDDLLTFFKSAVETKCEGIMVKVLDELTPEEKAQAEKEKADGKGSRRKALPATYEPDKRTLGWCKVKKDYADGSDSMDLVPIGAWYGNGRKAGWWSPILLALRNEEDGTLQAVCKCISGFTDQFYKDLNVTYSPDGPNTTYEKPWEYESALTPEIWFVAREVWEVRFADVTLSPLYTAAMGLVTEERGLSMRFPRFIKIRDDKGIDEASTGKELAAMWEKQNATTVQDIPEEVDEEE